MEKRSRASSKLMNTSNENWYLPQEIIEKILARLPVKSLLRFKCLSKLWCLLVSHNSFIKAHLVNSSKDKSFEHHHMIVGKYIVQANQFFLPSFRHEPRATAVGFVHPTLNNFYGIGSCNGLVCILKRAVDFILWNPSTRKFKKLPSFVSDTGWGGVCAYGFGFDESSDDYKVFCKWTNLEKEEQLRLYSSKMDSWRKVGDPMIDSDFQLYGSGIFVSGKLHWDGRYPSDSKLPGIVTFDLENEIFGAVELPSGTKKCSLGYKIDGCLCCISPSNSIPHYFDYWLMKEYGVKDSWYKFATFGFPPSYDYVYPCFLGANGDIFAWDGSSYVFLFKEDGHFFIRTVDNLQSLLFHAPLIYAESLVEP